MARAAYDLPGRDPHSGRWIALTAAMAVLVMAAAAAALALANGRAGGGSPQAGARASQSGPAVGPSPTVPRQTQATALAAGRRVAVAAGAAASPHARPVVAFLTRYFAAINGHDYRAYLRLYSPAIRGSLTPAAFSAGYGTTRDSLATLRHVGVTGPGHLDAVVTFTSHQQPGQSASQSACTRWRISLYLIREGNRYLLQTPPSGYLASFRACP
jgi:hypothetical protein